MDIKSMAKSKSKRHHSQAQHNQKHPKKPQQNPKNNNKQPPPPPSLPSNWSRYHSDDDDDDVDVDVDVVKPKSKGADYTSLISQAKESRSTFNDDSFFDSSYLGEGVGPMLALRGQSICLQDYHNEDDFLMEGKPSPNHQEPFLSLDLKDLAERLSKVDVAKRLFVEPHLFSSETQDQDDNNSANLVESPPIHKMERFDSFGELLALYLEEEQMAEMQDDMDKDLSSRHVPEQTETQAKDLGESALPKSESVNKDKMPDVSNIHEHDARPSSGFDAAFAEAELDMLLGSINETKIFDTPTNQLGTSASLKHPVGQSTPGFPVTSSLDDELDDLLAQTSNLNTDKHSVSQPMTQLASSSLSPPKDLEDFDSWMDALSK